MALIAQDKGNPLICHTSAGTSSHQFPDRDHSMLLDVCFPCSLSVHVTTWSKEGSSSVGLVAKPRNSRAHPGLKVQGSL